MNISRNFLSLRFLCVPAILALLTPGALGQDTLVALGQVTDGGAINSSANSVGGTVNAVRNNNGDYTVTVTKVGAFTGATPSDFSVEASIAGIVADDTTIRASISSVSNDVLAVDFLIGDCEHIGNPDQSEPANRFFFFTIRRLSENGRADGFSTHLEALGRVHGSGDLESGFGVDGVEVSSSKTGTGLYDVLLTKPGGFINDTAQQYVILVSHFGTGASDETVVAYPLSLASDDSVLVRVSIRDAQSAVESNSGSAIDRPFHFVIYRLGGDETFSNPDSRHFLMSTHINAGGSQIGRAVVPPGVVFNSFSAGTGQFVILLTKPKGFVGFDSGQLVAQVTSSGAPHLAIGASVSTFVIDDTLTVRVSTNDYEALGEDNGVPTNSSFFLTLYSAKANFRPDLRIGTKTSLSKMRGNGIYNTNGRKQTVKGTLSQTGRLNAYLAADNDGDSVDHIKLRSFGDRKGLKTRYFRLTGGKTNVTASIRKGGVAAPDVSPGKVVRFQAQFRTKSSSATTKARVRFLGSSLFANSQRDIAKLHVLAN